MGQSYVERTGIPSHDHCVSILYLLFTLSLLNYLMNENRRVLFRNLIILIIQLILFDRLRLVEIEIGYCIVFIKSIVRRDRR